MKKPILLIWILISSIFGNAQIIECDNFSQIGQTFFGNENQGPAQSYLGNSVATNSFGNIIAIAEPGYGVDEEGRVRIYELSGNTWVQLGQDLLGYTFNDDFGLSVDLSADGSIIAIGDEGNSNSDGYARVFKFNGSEWGQIGESISPGRTVSLNADGTTIACSSQFETGGLVVYNYDALDDAWNQVGSQINDLSSTGINFGHDVELNAQGDVVCYVSKDAAESEFKAYELQGLEWVPKGQIITFPKGTDVRLDTYGDKLVISGSIGFQQFIYNSDSWDAAGSNISPDIISGFTTRIDATPDLDYVLMSSDITGIGSLKLFKWYNDDWVQIGQDLIGYSSAAYGSDPVSINDTGDVFIVGNPNYNVAEGAATVWSINCPIEGCINSLACNYNPEATFNDGSCTFPQCYRDCDGNCIADFDNDGICDEFEAPYNPDSNSDQQIGVEDMLDLFPLFGMTFSASCPENNLQPESVYNPDYDQNGVIALADLLSLFPLYGQTFSSNECEVCIAGCTDPSALNFSTLATYDNGSCEYLSPLSCNPEEVFNVEVEYGSVTDVDGNVYRTVQIGNQEWMAENLRATSYSNGEVIPEITDQVEWNNLILSGADGWCYPDNDSILQCPFGKFYNKAVILDQRNVCPTGWHIPTEEDWLVLINEVGGMSNAGGFLKSPGIMYWSNPNVGSFSTGWAGIPSGIRGSEGFQFRGSTAWFWSSTIHSSGQFEIPRLYHSEQGFIIGLIGASAGMPARCVRNS